MYKIKFLHILISIWLLSLFLIFFKILFIFREGGREGEKKGEKHLCDRETSISCLLHAPGPGTEPVTQACALARYQTGDLLLCRSNIVTIFHLSHSDSCIMISHCGFNLHSVMANDVEQIFISLFSICLSSLVKCLFMTFAHFLMGLSLSLLLSF